MTNAKFTYIIKQTNEKHISHITGSLIQEAMVLIVYSIGF